MDTERTRLETTEWQDGRRSGALHLKPAVQTIRAGVFATLLAFGTTEAARLVMILARATRPTDELWPLLSGIQQVGWQMLLACYGGLLAGSAILRSGSKGSVGLRSGTQAIGCLSVVLASRILLITGISNLQDPDSRALLIEVATLLEGWSLLAFLWMIDLFIRELADEVGDEALRLAAASHAALTVCLGVAILVGQFLGEPLRFNSSAGKLEALLRLLGGAICLAWTFRLTSDAARVLNRIRDGERGPDDEGPAPVGT